MSILILILIILLVHSPLIILTFRIFTYGKFLLDMDLTKSIKKEKIIKEGVSIPSFEFSISKSTIAFLIIILSILLLIFTTNSILKNVNNNIDFVKKTFMIDSTLPKINKNITILQKNQIQIQKLQIELSKSILEFKINKKDKNGSK